MQQRVTWPDFDLPPINQYRMSCALSFYNPKDYRNIIENIKGVSINTTNLLDNRITNFVKDK